MIRLSLNRRCAKENLKFPWETKQVRRPQEQRESDYTKRLQEQQKPRDLAREFVLLHTGGLLHLFFFFLITYMCKEGRSSNSVLEAKLDLL